MSSAFTRETDDAPPPPTPERLVSGAPNLVTPHGASLIAAELAWLDAKLETASDPEEVASLKRERRYWASRQGTMKIVPPNLSPAAVGFGVSATIERNGKTLTLTVVGEDEADPAKGLLAWTSPLAKAIDGAEPGDVVEFQAGGHLDEVTILSVKSPASGVAGIN